MKSLFPKQEWTDFALNEVIKNGLDKVVPADAVDFRIDGTPESWVHLLTAIAKHESGFDPNQTYQESASLGGVISTGLFQMSYQSVRGYAKFARNSTIKAQVAAATTAKLKDPFFNITVAAIILQRWVVADGVIATGTKPWLGGARYWAVLRQGAPKVKATLKKIAESIPLPPKLNLKDLKPAAPAGTPAAVTANTPSVVALALQARANLGSKCNWVFEVDYSINSSLPRLFVYGISEKKLYKYKCAHGGGGANKKPHNGKIRQVSNVPGSGCSSLGVIRTGEPYTSGKVGKALRLHGLSPTNSNILARGVVMHGSIYVHDNEQSTDTSISGRSLGCIAVDDKYIDFEDGGEIIGWLKNGSIGVAHHAGKFTL